MEYRTIGTNKLKVSRMCLGTLTMGPLQCNMDIEDGAELIVAAVEAGINIIDTAELYQTYSYIKQALKNISAENRPNIITKSYAYTSDMMKRSLEKALDEMEVPKINVFLMHEQETELTLKGHMPAYEYLLQAKSERLIDAVGISCHSIEAVKAASKLDGIDCIMPIYNMAGIGIIDGTRQEMYQAITDAHKQGIGIIGMKALGGGHLIPDTGRALDFVLRCDKLDTIAIGIQNIDELKYNISVFNNELVDEQIVEKLRQHPRKLLIEQWCEGCGLCVSRCTANALSIINEKALVDNTKCRLCGYCGTVCPYFYIKVL